MLFIDRGVADFPTILRSLQPGIEAILLERDRPAARRSPRRLRAAASHNLPLHLFDDIAAPALPPIHVHYHWLASAGKATRNPLLDGRLHLPAEARAWLADRLPLTPPA